MNKSYSTDYIIKKVKKIIGLAKQSYIKAKLPNYNAIALSTSHNNINSLRMVLLKEIANNQFVFYTNKDSIKSQQINQNPNVAMLLYWATLKVQVRIEGIATEVSEQMVENYFKSRPYVSKIGAWASKQSSVLDSYSSFVNKVDFYKNKYPHNQDVPKPDFWVGFGVIPTKIEFWQEKDFRLHLRKEYLKNTDETWSLNILSP